MLHRILEPEVMDDDEQCVAYAEADFNTPNAAFVERFFDTFSIEGAMRLIDLGCGPAEIPVRLCRAHLGLHVTAVDASASMLKIAQRVVAKAELSARITLREAMLPLGEPSEKFDAVLSNSLLHHLPDPDVLWQEISRQGRPGTMVFVADLRRPSSEEEVFRLVEEYSEPEPAVLRHDFHNSLRAAFTPEEVKHQLEAAGLSQLHVQSISNRHLAVFGTL